MVYIKSSVNYRKWLRRYIICIKIDYVRLLFLPLGHLQTEFWLFWSPVVWRNSLTSTANCKACFFSEQKLYSPWTCCWYHSLWENPRDPGALHSEWTDCQRWKGVNLLLFGENESHCSSFQLRRSQKIEFLSSALYMISI